MHVNDAFKVAPATTPPTTGWNGNMLPTDIFNQLQGMYGKPTPDVMRQNNLAFLAPYNPQESPKLLFKQCTDCQEITILAKVPYTNKQMMMNVIDLLTCSGMFVSDLEDWDCKSSTDQTWINLHPFVQEAYQQRITSGAMTSAQGGYTGGGNRFAGLTAKDDVSDDNTAETIAGTIDSHMANLLLQTAATIEASKAQVNASLQQMAATQAHLQQQQHQMMQQMTMMLYAPPQASIQYQPAHFLQQQNTRFVMQVPAGKAAGKGSGSRGGCNRRSREGQRVGMIVPRLIPYLGGNQMIPYIPAGAQQQQVQPLQNP